MHIKYEDRWQSIFKDFEAHYERLASRVVEMYPVGRKIVVFILDDGNEVRYNFYNKNIRFIAGKRKKRELEDETELRNIFMQRLNDKMYLRGYTLERLSDATGISVVTLYKYTNGKSTPSIYNIKRLANVLDCTVEDLMYDFDIDDE